MNENKASEVLLIEEDKIDIKQTSGTDPKITSDRNILTESPSALSADVSPIILNDTQCNNDAKQEEATLVVNESVKPISSVIILDEPASKTLDESVSIDKITLPIAPQANSDDGSKESVDSDHTIKCPSPSESTEMEVPTTESTPKISRELKSLINSAKESKIISESTQIKTKMRKSRLLDTSALESDAEMAQSSRRSSTNSIISNSSVDNFDKTPVKRSMRSQNPEFLVKQKKFLSSVTGKELKEDIPTDGKEVLHTPGKKPKGLIDPKDSSKNSSDAYCWRCHWEIETSGDGSSATIMWKCTLCPRSYHQRCLTGSKRTEVEGWICPECNNVQNAENSQTRSTAMKKISPTMFNEILKFALTRLSQVSGVEPFTNPVDIEAFPNYRNYIVHPMDLSTVGKNIDKGCYGSTEAFLADVSWILHNSIIFNSAQTRLTAGAKALVRVCRAEMGEIEACPECYLAAHKRKPTWFTDVCSIPHIIVWAKLKGFPFWPAKAMSHNSTSGTVDVRFFGAHDRAWVLARDIFIYSKDDPNGYKTKRPDIAMSVEEAEVYIENLSKKFGGFNYAEPKTPYDPNYEEEQLKKMLPGFEGELPKMKPSSAEEENSDNKINDSKKSDLKGEENDDSIMEVEESARKSRLRRRMSGGADILGEEPETTDEKKIDDESTEMIVVESRTPQEAARKRKNLTEAVAVLVDPPKKVKRDAKKTKSETELQNTTTPTTPEKVIEQKTQTVVLKSTPCQAEKSTFTYQTQQSKTSNKVMTPKMVSIVKVTPKTNTEATKPTQRVTPSNVEEKSTIRRATSDPKIKTQSVKSSETPPNKFKSNIGAKAGSPKPGIKSTLPQHSDSGQNKMKDQLKKTSSDENQKSETPEQEIQHHSMPLITDVRSLASNEKDPLASAPAISVRSFARDPTATKKRAARPPSNFTPVTIKDEPIEVLDDDRENVQNKNDLLSSLHLVPAYRVQNTQNGVTGNKRIVIATSKMAESNKSPETTNDNNISQNQNEERPRARKTFPVPRRTNTQSVNVTVAASELNKNNSMVFIPITTNGKQNSTAKVVTSTQITNKTTTATTSSAPAITTSAEASKVNQRTTSNVSIKRASIAEISQRTINQTVQNANALKVANQTSNKQNDNNKQSGSEIINQSKESSSGTVQNEAPMVNGIPETTTTGEPMTTTTPATNIPVCPPLTKHPLDPEYEISSSVPPPSTAGPATLLLNQSAVKLTDMFRNLLLSSLEKVSDPAATIHSLKLQIEELKWRHKQELAEVQHNAALMVNEVSASVEKVRAKTVSETRRICEQELVSAIDFAKSRQWCANCRQEAQFYCCWNTSYCDYPCQQKHWPRHYTSCKQNNSTITRDNMESHRPPLVRTIMSTSTDASNQNKIAMRPYHSSTPLYVSIPPGGGNAQAVKLVTPSNSRLTNASGAPSLVLNHQMLADESGSGGYLIVSGDNITPTVSTSRFC